VSFFKQHVCKAGSIVLSFSVYEKKKPWPVRKFTAIDSMLPSHISKPLPTREGEEWEREGGNFTHKLQV
jgi:hypothetical protein